MALNRDQLAQLAYDAAGPTERDALKARSQEKMAEAMKNAAESFAKMAEAIASAAPAFAKAAEALEDIRKNGVVVRNGDTHSGFVVPFIVKKED